MCERGFSVPDPRFMEPKKRKNLLLFFILCSNNEELLFNRRTGCARRIYGSIQFSIYKIVVNVVFIFKEKFVRLKQ